MIKIGDKVTSNSMTLQEEFPIICEDIGTVIDENRYQYLVEYTFSIWLFKESCVKEK